MLPQPPSTRVVLRASSLLGVFGTEIQPHRPQTPHRPRWYTLSYLPQPRPPEFVPPHLSERDDRATTLA